MRVSGSGLVMAPAPRRYILSFYDVWSSNEDELANDVSGNLNYCFDLPRDYGVISLYLYSCFLVCVLLLSIISGFSSIDISVIFLTAVPAGKFTVLQKQILLE